MELKAKKKNTQLFLIAKYVVEKYQIKEPAKLQKILYFLFLDYLKINDEKLFKESFEAWVYGPVLPSIYAYIKENGFNFNLIEENLDKNIESFIDKNIKKYLKFETFQLINMSHLTEPWKKTRKGLRNDELSHKKISFLILKDYVKKKESRSKSYR